MRKMTAACLLLSIMLVTATPLQSQTRPRRVGQTAGAATVAPDPIRAEEPPPLASGRARTVRNDERDERARRGSRWPRVLLGAGLAIGIGTLGRSGSCTPSRGTIGSLPRLMSRANLPR